MLLILNKDKTPNFWEKFYSNIFAVTFTGKASRLDYS